MGELSVRMLLNNSTVTDRIWQHKYNKRKGWQYGEVTVSQSSQFSVSCVFLLISHLEKQMTIFSFLLQVILKMTPLNIV